MEQAAKGANTFIACKPLKTAYDDFVFSQNYSFPCL